MPRRYQTNRRRRKDPQYRRRLPLMKPGTQIAIVLVAALIVYILLQSGGK